MTARFLSCIALMTVAMVLCFYAVAVMLPVFLLGHDDAR